MRIAIIGGGWAGIAAAVELVDRGAAVTLIEAGRALGGRARRAATPEGDLDNGQHILLGAYHHCLALMRRVGARPEEQLLRLPLRLADPRGFCLALPRLPAPLHLAWGLLTARGPGWMEKLRTALWMQRLKARRFRIEPDTSVSAWLDASGQTGVLRRHLWEPLCLAALNTPPARASAQIFAHVLRDSLASASPGATDLLLPRGTLSDLLPTPAAAWLSQRGAIVRTGIGALIVLAGELIYQLMNVVQKVGGLGEAFRLVADFAAEAWDRMGLRLDAVMARIGAAWEGLKATVFTLLDDTVTGVVRFGDRSIAVFQGAYDGAVAIWGSLPGAIGDFAFQAANGLISGVEAMLNGVVSRINGFIEALNAALALLPEWATGEGGVRIGTLYPVALGRIGNPFEGAATAAGTAAADAFTAAMGRTYVTAPDTGLGAMADAARGRADGYAEAAGMLSDAASRPMASWQALKDAVTGTGDEAGDALDDATGGALGLGDALDGATGAAGRAGAAGRQAGADAAAGAETAVTGWAAVSATLADYAAKAREIGGDIGNTLVGAFTSAENAIGEFVKTGKLNFRDLVTSLIADLAKLAARRFILGPIANALSGALGGAGGIFANVLHAGGMVGSPGPGRMVPTLAFAGAPRMHSGGWAGLRPDEVPAILHRGERVLSRREAAGYGSTAAPAVNVTINARDAESFRQSRTQIAADIARAVSLGRRGM